MPLCAGRFRSAEYRPSMMDVTFPEPARAALAECMGRPYPSLSASGELVAERDENGRYWIVLTDVPTGHDVNELVGRVADETKNGLVPGVRGLHNESPES